jgi:hypothetical protein
MSIMDDDLDLPSSPGSLIKWPFYVANALILGIVVSYLLNRPQSPIDKWEVATCVFAVALSAMLFFVPHLVEYFITVSLPEKSDSPSDHGISEKTYLELKGIKEDLSDFGVKLEKIPSIVETIAKGALAGNGDSDVLTKLEDELGALRSQLEQTSATTSGESDPRLTDLVASVVALEKTIDRIADDLAERSPPNPEEEPDEEDEELEDNLAKVDRILEETQSTGPEETEEEDEEETGELDLGDPDDESEPEEEPVSDDEPVVEDIESESEGEEDETDGDEPDSDPTEEESEDEDDAPEETERVEEEEPIDESDDDSDESPADPAGVLKGVSQFDVVVAKILPGIGNKVHVRGEGPGLSWDEGVPMSFLEIGKWGWSPPDKSTPIVVQLYKNDEEPDGNGKVELEPGEKVEITPSFGN